MPYIDDREGRRHEVRQAFARATADALEDIEGVDPGDLAFLIADAVDTVLIWLDETGGYHYRDLATIDGVLGTAQHEFRRRILDPYEDLARATTREVYTVLED